MLLHVQVTEYEWSHIVQYSQIVHFTQRIIHNYKIYRYIECIEMFM